MITTTWRELITAKDQLLQDGDHVYEFLDHDGTILYVGRALRATERILSHVGIGSRAVVSPVGRFLKKHKPSSYDWQIKVYDSSDYAPSDYEHFEVDRIIAAAPVFNKVYNWSRDGSRPGRPVRQPQRRHKSISLGRRVLRPAANHRLQPLQ